MKKLCVVFLALMSAPFSIQAQTLPRNPVIVSQQEYLKQNVFINLAPGAGYQLQAAPVVVFTPTEDGIYRITMLREDNPPVFTCGPGATNNPYVDAFLYPGLTPLDFTKDYWNHMISVGALSQAFRLTQGVPISMEIVGAAPNQPSCVPSGPWTYSVSVTFEKL